MMNLFSARPELVPQLKKSFSCYGRWVSTSLPLVYSDHYNIHAFGLQRLHPFDACKFEKIVALLEKKNLCQRSKLSEPVAITEELLTDVHSKAYLDRIKKDKFYLCQIVELPLFFLPLFLLRRVFTTSSYYHAAGTILAMGLAVEKGWAINIGGGMHHARHGHGEGWCFFADTILGIRAVRKETNNAISKVLYIDVDVHQGNGVARDKLFFDDQDLFILDVYNADVWPRDIGAKRGIDVAVELYTGTNDETYLKLLEEALEKTKAQFSPDLIVYNAGTDILAGDRLGLLQVSPQGVIERDELVFRFALEMKAPIVMMTSGGYTRLTHKIIANSIINLISTFQLNKTTATT